MYQIVVADDHPLFREAICSVIRSHFTGSTIVETESLESTLEAIQEDAEPDLLLLDLNMPGMQGLTGLLSVRNRMPTLPVVILSAESDKQVVLQAINYGAVGYISKALSRSEMTRALDQVFAGQVYLPPDIIRMGPRPVESSSVPADTGNDAPALSPEQLRSLTRRQLLVLERMVQGESNKQIAYQLNIAETTVKGHVSAILRKLGVHNRVQAVLSANRIDFSQYLRR